MTIVDTVADAHYRDKVALAMAFAELLNDEARELAKIGVDVIQFDEPAFNVYMKEVAEWGIMALHRAAEGLPCKTAVHICYGYGIKANIDWKASLGAEWRQYKAIFPALAESRIDQVSVECAGARVPLDRLTRRRTSSGPLRWLPCSRMKSAISITASEGIPQKLVLTRRRPTRWSTRPRERS